MAKLRVAILGSTGAVGQRFVELLSLHPWFEITKLCASERSEGKSYKKACSWKLATPLPDQISEMPVEDISARSDVDLAFSALSADAAFAAELEWAQAGVPVFSNARSYRMEPDVPLLIPEINPDHLTIIPEQKEKRGFPGNGFIVTNPNCSTIFLAMALAPLERAFGIRKVSVVTLQAVSGAGYPGIPSLDILGNIIPFISGEEEKMEAETKKILGQLKEADFYPAEMAISAQVNRIPVIDGHTEAVSFQLATSASQQDILEALASWQGEPQERELPSAPKKPIVVLNEPDRPQPALDVNRERGMATLIGRLRPCPVLDYKMTILGHNTVRGAAGASILNAELAHKRGLITCLEP
jgi:aspartate-semialdehyde dehydrogenase